MTVKRWEFTREQLIAQVTDWAKRQAGGETAKEEALAFAVIDFLNSPEAATFRGEAPPGETRH